MMNADEIRERSLSFLESRGFRPARWLPKPETASPLRPAREIAVRLMALDAVFTWVTFPEASAETDRIRKYIHTNHLRDWMTEEETEIIDLPRDEAHDEHVDIIGWRLENMWPLAWVLGFDPAPNVDEGEIPTSISRDIVYRFLVGLDGTVDMLLAKSKLRPVAEVVAMEDLFFCAHNAVRSAQTGEPTVPDGFEPILHGGCVHERRHALTWCINPEVSWEETDLST